jgi:outer membrane lipoprotein SlyB
MNPQPQSSGSPLRSDTLFSDTVPPALKALVDRFGAELLAEPARLRGLLADEVPQARKEISVLMLALEERVPQDLMRVHSGESASSLTPRLARRLTEEKSLSPDAARWAVNAWAYGMGLEAIVDSQPAREEPGFGGAAGAAALAGGQAAANQTYDRSLPRPAPVPVPPSPWSNRMVQIGAAAVAAIVIGGGAWWYSTPKLEIARVETAGVFIGNGKPQPVYIDFDARNVQVRSVEVKLVKGDGNWGQTNWKAEVTPEGPNRVAAGTLAVNTSTPITATFEYVLVGADGKRSEPFQRTFDVLPPLTITKISVPRSMQVGREFALDIAFQKSAAEVVRIERKVVDSTQPWAQNEVAQQIKIGADATSLQYKFEPFAKPTRATLEFTLVDAAGVRSEPVRVALNVGNAVAGTGPGTVVSIRLAKSAPAADTSGIGAVIGAVTGAILGNQVGGGTGRTVATIVGGVSGAWAGNEVEKRFADNPNAHYETTIRFDDGTTRTITTKGAPRWKEGTRVTWDGRELAPAKA